MKKLNEEIKLLPGQKLLTEDGRRVLVEEGDYLVEDVEDVEEEEELEESEDSDEDDEDKEDIKEATYVGQWHDAQIFERLQEDTEHFFSQRPGIIEPDPFKYGYTLGLNLSKSINEAIAEVGKYDQIEKQIFKGLLQGLK